MNKQELLPIGTRVTHFGGGIDTHGTGTIIAYNGVEPSQYLENNFKEAVTMAAEAGLLGAIPSMIYDKVRCPYVVHFDIHPHKKDRYPRGYKDVYETDRVRPVMITEKTFETIFDNDWSQIMARKWKAQENKWTDWVAIDQVLYESLKRDPDAEFCVRQQLS
jgi:hypothetical protein